MPADNPEKFAVAVEPVIVEPTGLAVTVHAEVGKPLNATVDVAVAHVGCVIVPTVGADGVTGWAMITALPEATEVQPEEVNVTVNVYVLPADNPEKFAVAIEPVIVAPPGLAVTVHAEVGKPLNATVAVGIAHVGCVIVPTVGADGVTGWAMIIALPEATEVQPEEVKVTVNV